MDEASLAATEQMNDCKYLDVISTDVTAGYGLRIIIHEIVPQLGFPENPERDYAPELAKKIRSQMETQVLPKPRSFDISFKEIVSYLMTNESYGKYPSDPEAFTGRLFRRFSRSRLLELMKDTTYASDHHPGPGPLMHFEVVGQDDVVDVISCVEPEIRMQILV
jgi:hypothetical protein